MNWAYQPPHRPEGFAEQCYYRTSGQQWRHSVHVAGRAEGDPKLTVYRSAGETSVTLTAELCDLTRRFQVTFECGAASLRALHAALGDALQDIDAVEAERERRDSFDRISEEMRDAEELGGPAVYYAHPDIHYVPADQVAAKVAELEAAGCKRYMVQPTETEAA